MNKGKKRAFDYENIGKPSKRVKYSNEFVIPERLMNETLYNYDMLYLICQYLTTDEIYKCVRVCSQWKCIILEKNFVISKSLRLFSSSYVVVNHLARNIESKMENVLNELVLIDLGKKLCHRLGTMIKKLNNNRLSQLKLLHLSGLVDVDNNFVKHFITKKFDFSNLIQLRIENCFLSLNSLNYLLNLKPISSDSKEKVQMDKILMQIRDYINRNYYNLLDGHNCWCHVTQFLFINSDKYTTFTLQNMNARVCVTINRSDMLPHAINLEQIYRSHIIMNMEHVNVLQLNELQELSLTRFSTSTLKMPVLVAPNLKKLFLHSSSISGLRNIDLLLPNVETCMINIDGPTDITFRNLNQIKVLELDCPKCKDLRISICTSPLFTGMFLKQVLSKCFKDLEVLILNKIEYLDELDAENGFSLKYLVLNDCRSLRKVTCFQSRNLNCLFIQNCPNLMEAKFWVQRSNLQQYQISGHHSQCSVMFGTLK